MGERPRCPNVPFHNLRGQNPSVLISSRATSRLLEPDTVLWRNTTPHPQRFTVRQVSPATRQSSRPLGVLSRRTQNRTDGVDMEAMCVYHTVRAPSCLSKRMGFVWYLSQGRFVGQIDSRIRLTQYGHLVSPFPALTELRQHPASLRFRRIRRSRNLLTPPCSTVYQRQQSHSVSTQPLVGSH
jgi:hypothetical protein